MLRAAGWSHVRAAVATWRAVGLLALLPAITLVVHLLEVHLLDPPMTAWVRATTGWTFALPDLAPRLDLSTQAAIGAYYLVAFLALLAWTPALVAAAGDATRLRRLLLAYPLLYALALPGFLLFPADNPYTRAGDPSPFTPLHPRLEDLYYLLTTRDNTLPSLHVAFTLVCAHALWHAWPDWRLATATHATLLVVSVILARVHYIADVLAGALIAGLALWLTTRWIPAPADKNA